MHPTRPLVPSNCRLRLCLCMAGLVALGWPAANADLPAPTRLGSSDRSFGDLIRRWHADAQPGSGELLFDQLMTEPGSDQERQQSIGPDTSDTEPGNRPPGGEDRQSQELSPVAPRTADAEPSADSSASDRQRRERTLARIAELKKPTSEIFIDARPDGATPANLAGEYAAQEPTISISALGIGTPGPNRYTVCFAHRPLYFEQRNLERCGHGCGCWQNKISAAQFLWNTACLPYRMGQQACCSCVPAGGDCLTCQPGPPDCNPFPLDRHGLVSEAAAIAGFTFLLL